MRNRIQEHRLERGLTQPELAEELCEVEPKLDAPMISKYENGVCLPTRAQLDRMEWLLGKSRTELYDAEDLDLLGYLGEVTAKRERTAKEYSWPSRTGSTRKCYRISKAFAQTLPEDLLDVCGYSSWQSWHDAALKRLLGEYAARKKAQMDKEKAERRLA